MRTVVYYIIFCPLYVLGLIFGPVLLWCDKYLARRAKDVGKDFFEISDAKWPERLWLWPMCWMFVFFMVADNWLQKLRHPL